jgi:DNA-directed RNA polymerase specialized sigma24 family protein
MTAKNRDDEIKRALIADANNPDAWERVATVPSSTSPRPAWYGKARTKRQLPTQARTDHAARQAEALRRKQWHDAVAALPEGQRHAVQLWLDGFNYTDIAHALGVSVDAVKSRLRDGKRHLRPSLEGASGRDTHHGGRRTGAKAR